MTEALPFAKTADRDPASKRPAAPTPVARRHRPDGPRALAQPSAKTLMRALLPRVAP